MPNSKDLQSNTENLPTHEEIEKRAYELYLQGGDVFSATEHWLIAEEQLKTERAMADAKPPKEKTAAAVPDRVAKRYNQVLVVDELCRREWRRSFGYHHEAVACTTLVSLFWMGGKLLL